VTIDETRALQDLVSRGINIPPQPKVLLELQQELLRDDYDARSLARIIAQDPGIVAMLFKAARSPVFARGKKVETLEQILMVIGVKQTFNLVQAVALATVLSDSARKAYEVFWTRSQEVAQIAAMIAEERISVCNVFPDQAYMAGIFHECGVPVLMQRFRDYADKLHLESATCWPDLATEDAQFNVDHCSIGYLVGRHWKLPDFVCAAIRYHHDLPTDEAGAARSLVAILQLAIHFYHRLARAGDPVWANIGEQVMNELGIPVEDEDDFFELIADRFTGH
jgi:HD-like signal output (HDOD) protein